MKEKPPKKPAIKTAMRIPAELHADIAEAAKRADHSMNAEIIHRLTAGAGGVSLFALAEQNVEIMAEIHRTQEMVREIITALKPRR
jgi:hypothetical protein